MGWADWFSWGQLQHRIYTGSRGSAPLKREINHCLSFSGNGYKSPGCADLQSLMEQFLLSLSPVLSITLSCFLLSLSFSLLALYFLDVSTCRCLVLHLSLLAVLHSVLFFFFFFPISVLCLPPALLLLLSLPSSLMMCLAFKASHCCITGLFVSPSCKERKRCDSSGRE